MKNVRHAVDRIFTEAATPVHSQSVVISQRSHQELRALAEYMKRSKSSLASELLEAAILDVYDYLAEMELPSGEKADGSPITAADFVRLRANQLHRDFVQQYEAEQKRLSEVDEYVRSETRKRKQELAEESKVE